MRDARLVGLSPDGKSLIVVTETGEELAIAADERLRAAVRGDRPRLGQLEIEMKSALSPRDIQARIRAGESLENVGRIAGIPLDRVERFAAPVLAEREHVAAQAMSASVRRRGETSGHRSLRVTVTERLLTRGVDIDTIALGLLPARRRAVGGDRGLSLGEANRHATFTFDPRGRFSVASNDEAHWLLGEHSAAKGPQPGRRRPVDAEALRTRTTSRRWTSVTTSPWSGRPRTGPDPLIRTRRTTTSPPSPSRGCCARWPTCRRSSAATATARTRRGSMPG